MTLLDGDMKERIDWLKKILDFCNVDLESIKGQEREALFLTLLKFAARPPLSSYPDKKHDEIILGVAQKKFIALLDFLIEERMRYDVKNRPYVLGFVPPAVYHPYFYIHPDKRFRFDLESSVGGKANRPGVTVRYFTELKPWEADRIDTSKERQALKELLDDTLFPEGEPPVFGGLLMNFCLLLLGIPAQWILKCRGCGHYFLNPTDREKIYCNSSCASRTIARDKRNELKKDPKKYQAYLEKQNKYMKKKYREKKKELVGPNVKVGWRRG